MKSIKKTVLLATISLIGLGLSGRVLAAEGQNQIIDGSKGQNSADIITRGNLGEIDNTDPDTPLPDGDERWINVTLPTEVIFESTDSETITSPKNYQIVNNSGRPVKVDVDKYVITGGNGVPALTSLNIKRTTGFEGSPTVSLVSSKAEAKEYKINKELVRLANKEGKFADEVDGAKSTNFEFTGTMNKEDLSEKQNYIESKLSFKFTSLRMDGTTV
ncbi:hypothetical protein [Lactococcus petauri]|uniref:hypothetical protein n=1 Tax=Lactococcus petauri TaxID=1940789 RepID=UPI00254AC66E|nr:hypothetical protein [Lactococcus petauri]